MKNNFGLTLIEVLISLLLFGLILLGFDVMQMTAMKINQAAYDLTVATVQMHSMAERLKAHAKDNWQAQASIWNSQNAQLLPKVSGKITGQYPSFSLELCYGGEHKCIHENNIRINAD